MKIIMSLVAVALLGSACAVKTERTVATRPITDTETVIRPNGYTTTTTTYQEPVSSTTTVKVVPR